MTFKQLMETTEPYKVDRSTKLLRTMCYEIHMLEITNSIDYRNFNHYEYIDDLSLTIKDAMNQDIPWEV